MVERENLSRLSLLALQKRREGLVRVLPSLSETLRGTLMERYLTCGKPDCKCSRGERHGPVWYLSVTLGQGQNSSRTLAAEQVERARRWIDNYHRIKNHLEKISDINRELLRRERNKARSRR